MKKFTSILLALVLLSSVFAGCASNEPVKNHKKNKDNTKKEEISSDETEDEIKDEPEVTTEATEEIEVSQEVTVPEETTVEETELTESSETSEVTTPAKYNVTKNNTYFVEINDRVYFRVYGEAAFENPVVFGNFQYYPTGNLSSICYYDKTTGEVVYAFDDWGFGDIVFYNGIFYMNGYEKAPNGDTTQIVYAVDMDGNRIDSFPTISGSIVGNNEACHQFYVMYHEYDYETGSQTDQLLTFDDNGSLIAVYDGPTYMNYVDCSPDFVLFTSVDYDDSNNYTLALYSMSAPDTVNGFTVRKLGTFESEPMQSISIEQYWYSDLEETEYISIGYYEGTGHFLAKTECYSIIPWEENSLELKKQMADEETYQYFTVIDDEIVVTDVCYDTFHLNTYDSLADKDLMYANPYSGEVEVFYPNYIPGGDYYEERYFDFYSENVNGTAFLMRAKEIFDDSASIGWRDGFRLITMEYLMINEAGELIPLISVDHNVVEAQ